MDPTADQACENNNKSTIENSLLDKNPSKPIKIWRLLLRTAFAFLLSYIAFLLFSNSPLSLPKFHVQRQEDFNVEAYLDQITNLSVQLDRRIIQANSLEAQIFPMHISREIQNLEAFPAKPVDLICVFDFSRRDYERPKELTLLIRSFLRHILPLMIDQNRLSIVLISEEWGKSLVVLPFTNTTRENWKKIISSVDGYILREEIPEAEIPANILDQRNQTIGIFLFSDRYIRLLSTDLNKIGLQDIKTVMRSGYERDFPYTRMIESFQKGLKALQNYVVETKLIIKPEQSPFFEKVRINNDYEDMNLHWKNDDWWPMWEEDRDGNFFTESTFLNLGLKEEFFFDIVLWRTVHNLPENPIEVKVASCQQVFVLLNGTKVIKNFDLTVKVVREGEVFLNEDDRGEEIMKHFYKKWGQSIFNTPLYKGNNFVVNPIPTLRRYKESLGNSIVKNDEELQLMVQKLERKTKSFCHGNEFQCK